MLNQVVEYCPGGVARAQRDSNESHSTGTDPPGTSTTQTHTHRAPYHARPRCPDGSTYPSVGRTALIYSATEELWAVKPLRQYAFSFFFNNHYNYKCIDQNQLFGL